jgi:hypothetical protein
MVQNFCVDVFRSSGNISGLNIFLDFKVLGACCSFNERNQSTSDVPVDENRRDIYKKKGASQEDEG